ncbi:MAG TPA: ABC transporter ATP-binding protein [Conexibacter sp.]|nr:ABC transporter ATP-binding protein [Conexibacter sp.]
MAQAHLELRDVSAGYGGSLAVEAIALDVHAGEVVTLLGANGAGKSTTLRAISGMVRPSAGSIVFGGTDITTLRPDEIVRAGIVHVPEGRDVFAGLSVRDNLLAGGYVHRASQHEVGAVHELFPVLRERGDQLAGSLSGGEQQMLAIGRGLMSQPKLLLLDEPTLGLAPLIIERIFDALEEINARGTTVLLVEQNANVALAASDRAYVLATGRIVLTDDSAELLGSDVLRQAYLGHAAASTGGGS